jgi:hypothetical protein
MHGQQCLRHSRLRADQLTHISYASLVFLTSHSYVNRLSVHGQDGRTGLLAMARDHSAPPTATATGALTASSALRETVTQLAMAIPGERAWRPFGHRGYIGSSAHTICRSWLLLAGLHGLHDLGHAQTMFELHVLLLVPPRRDVRDPAAGGASPAGRRGGLRDAGRAALAAVCAGAPLCAGGPSSCSYAVL